MSKVPSPALLRSATHDASSRARRYAVGGSKDEWAAAEAQVAARMAGGKQGLSSTVSVKNPSSTKALKRNRPDVEDGAKQATGKKDKKDKKRRKQ